VRRIRAANERCGVTGRGAVLFLAAAAIQSMAVGAFLLGRIGCRLHASSAERCLCLAAAD